jgi:outer membrane protein assembly factor BamE (lipoprotein component of BamABCDE complex)
MKRLVILLSVAALSLVVFNGCAHKAIRHGTEITDDEVAQIQDGKTTKDEIYLMFGEPKKILEDGRVFVYNWVRGSKTSFMGLGAGTAYGHSLIITFDQSNIVKAHRVTRGDVDAATGIGD